MHFRKESLKHAFQYLNKDKFVHYRENKIVYLIKLRVLSKIYIYLGFGGMF